MCRVRTVFGKMPLEEVKEDMEGFMTKPMIWLGRRVMKVRKKKKP